MIVLIIKSIKLIILLRDDTCYMELSTSSIISFVHINLFGLFLKKEYGLSYSDIQILIKDLMEKYFKNLTSTM